MADYIIAYKLTMRIEGGWVHDPKDRGGETYKGIARNFHPTWRGWPIIDTEKKKSKEFKSNLSKIAQLEILVQDFYRVHFWDVNLLSTFKSQKLANEIFDTGVNMGPSVPILHLQRSLNLLNRNQASYKDIKVDGVMGVGTLSLVNNHPSPDTLLVMLNIFQGHKYISIAEANPSQERFMYGWLDRVYGLGKI